MKEVAFIIEQSYQNLVLESLRIFEFQIFGTDEISAIFDKVAHDMEVQMRPIMNNPTSPLVAALPSLLEAVYLARQSREVVTALALLQKVQLIRVSYYIIG